MVTHAVGQIHCYLAETYSYMTLLMDSSYGECTLFLTLYQPSVSKFMKDEEVRQFLYLLARIGVPVLVGYHSLVA
jgi:hypothetical protein